jgi:LacI family transcriptional regulator
VVRVDADALGAGALIARHLFGLGHRHIAFVGDPSTHGFRHRALAGFRRAHREYGLSFRPSRILPCHRPDEVCPALAQLLAADHNVSALVVTTDLLAMAVLRVLADHGRHVPGDMSLVVLGESALTTYTQPALTAIRLPIAEDCQQAVDLLIEMLNGRRPSQLEHILPVELVICDSTRRVGPALTRREDSAQTLPDLQPLAVV